MVQFLIPFAEAGAEGAAVGSEAAGVAAEAGAEGAEGAAETAGEGESTSETDEEISKRAQRRKGQGSQEHKSPTVTVTKTVDKTADLLKVLKEFTRERVLVGIASSTEQRLDGSPINNATIGLIMEKGSPASNIPARPWLVPGIMSVRKDVIGVYLAATRSAFHSYNSSRLHTAHDRVGAIARDGVKGYIKAGRNFTPLAPATVAARYRQRGAKRRRKGETQYLAAVAGGMKPGLAESMYGIKPLINTGTFLNAITYAVREKGAKPVGGVVL